MARRIAPDDLLAIVRQLLSANGVDDAQVVTVSDNLVWNDQVGRNNHGVERLAILLQRVRAGLIRCPCHMVENTLGSSVMNIDAGAGFGQHAGHIAMGHAIDMAKAHGAGIVGVRNSNFFGTGACFVQICAAQGMIGLALSNSFAKVAAHGGIAPVLGTNPLAFGAPRRDGRSLLIDMSTAGLAGSTIRAALRQNTPLPEGLVIDDKGEPVTDPRSAAQETLLPAAGAKGFGLALMVEVLSAVLTGAGMSQQVNSLYKDFEHSGQSGHFFMALDISRWMEIGRFFDRMEMLLSMLRQSGAQDAVRIPGELRWDRYEENRIRGIPLEQHVITALQALADDSGIKVSLPV